MGKTLVTPTTPAESAELEVEAEKIITEINRTTERMRCIQERTERLGAETRAMLSLLKAS